MEAIIYFAHTIQGVFMAIVSVLASAILLIDKIKELIRKTGWFSKKRRKK